MVTSLGEHVETTIATELWLNSNPEWPFKVDFQDVDFGFMLPKHSSRHFLRYHGLSYFLRVVAGYNPCSRLNDKSIKCQNRVVVPSEFSSARAHPTWKMSGECQPWTRNCGQTPTENSRKDGWCIYTKNSLLTIQAREVIAQPLRPLRNSNTCLSKLNLR